jgi:hypothetical protein
MATLRRLDQKRSARHRPGVGDDAVQKPSTGRDAVVAEKSTGLTLAM